MVNIKNQIIIKNYDSKKYNFYSFFFNLLKIYTNELDQLHKNLPKNLIPKQVVTVKNDQNLSIYKMLYKIDEGYDLQIKKKIQVF